MPLFGPRLDAPTAIGDEGRPRATALQIAALAVGAVAVGLAVGADLAGLIGGVASSAAFVLAGLALLGRERFAHLAVGHLFVLPMALTLAGTVVAAGVLESTAAALTLGGLALAILGVGTAWANVDADALAAANRQAWIAGLLALVALPVVLVGLAIVVLIGGAVLPAAVLPATGPDLDGLALIGATTAGLLAVALWWLPIAALAPAALAARVGRVVRWCRLALLVAAVSCGGLWLPLAVAEVAGLGPGLTPTLDRGLASPVVRAPPLALAFALATLGAIAAALRAGVRWLTRGVSGPRARQIAPLVGASVIVALGAMVVALLSAGAGSGSLDAPAIGALQVLAIAVLTAVIAALAVFFVLVPLAVLVALASVGWLPRRAGPVALAAAGLLVVAVGVAAIGPVWAPVPVVVAALVVWDAGEFGLGLTAELGHRPITRGVELVHASAVLAVAGVAALVGVAITVVVGWAPIESLGVTALAGLAALFAQVPLRR